MCGNAGLLQQRSSSRNFSTGSSSGWVLTCRWRQSVVAQPYRVNLLRVSGLWVPSKAIDYPFIDFRLFKRCLQGTASNVFGSLAGLAMIEIIINHLKGTETRDRMSSRPALKRAILTNDLSMPHLGDVVANNIGVWPMIVSYLKEKRRKDDGDSLVVSSSSFDCVGALSYPRSLYIVMFQKRGIDGYLYLDKMARTKFRLLHLFLEFCK